MLSLAIHGPISNSSLRKTCSITKRIKRFKIKCSDYSHWKSVRTAFKRFLNVIFNGIATTTLLKLAFRGNLLIHILINTSYMFDIIKLNILFFIFRTHFFFSLRFILTLQHTLCTFYYVFNVCYPDIQKAYTKT